MKNLAVERLQKEFNEQKRALQSTERVWTILCTFSF